MLIKNATNTDLNVLSDGWSSPLMLACENDYIDIAELLIKKGVDINLQDSNGDTALTLAVSNDNVEIVKLLQEAV